MMFSLLPFRPSEHNAKFPIMRMTGEEGGGGVGRCRFCVNPLQNKDINPLIAE